MEKLSIDQISSYFNINFNNAYTVSTADTDMFTAIVEVNQIYKIINHLYKDHELGFQFLTDICGVHYPEQASKEIGVVYHLQSMVKGARIRLKVFVPSDKPDVPTMTGIYASANWMERETYDFYGVNFLGHPNLKRILNMDEMTAFPMRKEYPLEDPTREDKADYQFGR